MKPYLQFLFMLTGLFLTSIGLQAQTPVAQYSFTGNANDLASFGNNAVVNGATPTQDRFNLPNRAFAFDGLQSSIRANNAAQLNSANTTISFWIKVAKLPVSGEAYIMSHGGYQERWKISLPSHGRPVFTTNSAGGSIKDIDTDSVPLPVGAWRHVVMTHDGTNDKVYINGVLKNSKASPGALNSTTKPFGMGYDPIDATNYFNGSLDEVMMFNTALTAAEITTLYTAQSTAPAVVNERVAAYSFNGSGYDSSAYANHASLTNVKATTDRFGFGSKAYEFDGKSSAIKASNNAALNSANTTVSFWVKMNALPVSGEAYLLSFGGYQERWKISLPDHGKVVFSTNNVVTGNVDVDAGDGNALPLGIWKHVVMTHDGVNDKVFVDGIKKNSKPSAGALKNTVNPLGMGYDPIGNSSFFNGSLDEVQVYNYSLTEGEVTALYTTQSLSPAPATDLVADYKLNGNGNDDSQFGNTATGKATPTANRFGFGGNAMSFNGTKSDSLIATNSVAYQSDFETISFWVKVNALPTSGEVTLLSHGGWQERWKISLPDHGKPVFSTNSVGGIKDMDSDSVPLPVGAWRHVVMVHDGVINKMFINGLLKKTLAATGALNKTSKPLGIGYNAVDGGGNFNGSLDDIKIYNRALTDAEIAALYTTQSATPTIAGTLVAHYPFNNDGADVTPYANVATLTNATLATDRFGKVNKALAVNNSQAKAANSPQLNSANTSISFWVKVAELPASGEVYLLSHGGYQERWKISLPGHGKPAFSTKNATGSNVDMDSDSVPLPVGQWRHVVATHDGINNKIYINGLLKNSKASPGALGNSTKSLGIGYDPIDSSGFFNGSLDDVQIYNVALTDAEVLALYTAQNTAPANTDTQAPSAPLSLSAAVSFTTVTLSWLPSTDNVGVVAYNVFKNNVLILTTTNTSTPIAGLTATTKFTFGVTAVDAAGNQSAMSTLQVTTGQDPTPDTQAPSVPANFAAQVGSNSVQLSWTASTDNRGVVGYIIFQDGIEIDKVLAPTLSKFVSGLTATTAYTIEIQAYDAANNKSAKAEKTVNTLAPVNTGEPGLVANYPFDDNANDATPYANHGTIGGNPTFITHAGFTGKAIKFDGDKDSVVVKNAVQLLSDYTTVSFWIRVDSSKLSDSEAYVIDFGHWDQRWKVSLPTHLKIVWTTNSKDAIGNTVIKDMDSGDGNEMTKGLWWYVTMVHDGVNNIIYVNGIETQKAPTTGKLNSTARPLVFGSDALEGGRYFVGALDNVKIYNKALTAAEINKLFKTGTTPTDDQPSIELLAVVKSISPNPTADFLTIKHAFTGNEDVLVRVFDLAGRQIDALSFGKNQIPSGQFSLNVSQYPQGTYLLNFVQAGKSLGALKFFKK